RRRRQADDLRLPRPAGCRGARDRAHLFRARGGGRARAPRPGHAPRPHRGRAGRRRDQRELDPDTGLRRNRLGMSADLHVEPTAVARSSSVFRIRNVALQYLQKGGILLPFLILFTVLSLTSEPFATKTNLLLILEQQSSALI